MRVPPVRVCRTKVSNNFTTSNPVSEYLQWRLNETPKTINEVTVHLIRYETRKITGNTLYTPSIDENHTLDYTPCFYDAVCKIWSYDHRFARPTIYDQRLYTLVQRLVATTSEVTAGARGRHVVGVAVRTYVADQHTSSPAHPAGLLLLLLQTLSADSRGNF